MKKSIVMAAIAALALTSCGTTRNVYVGGHSGAAASEQKNELQLSNAVEAAFANQGELSIDLIEFGFGTSGDKAKAQRDALRAAQNNIALRLYRSISMVDTDYGNDITANGKSATQTKRTEMITGVVDNKVATIRYASKPVFVRTEDGLNWECQVEVVLQPALVESITKEIYEGLASDDELKVRFDEQKFYEDTYKSLLEDYRKNQPTK